MPQENYYSIYEAYETSVKGQDIFKEENFYDMEDRANQIDGDLDFQPEVQPELSTAEKIRAASIEAGLEEYEVMTEGDVKDGEAGVAIKISGYYSAPELRWLLDAVESTNKKVYGATSHGEIVADGDL
jgi:hypothetical protein